MSNYIVTDGLKGKDFFFCTEKCMSEWITANYGDNLGDIATGPYDGTDGRPCAAGHALGGGTAAAIQKADEDAGTTGIPPFMR